VRSTVRLASNVEERRQSVVSFFPNYSYSYVVSLIKANLGSIGLAKFAASQRFLLHYVFCCTWRKTLYAF